MKYKYPLNHQFDMEIKGKSYNVDINIFDEQDEYSEDFKYTVEIFPEDQSKESFENAEFWGTYTNENGINMQSYPKEWNSESIMEFTKNVVLGISNLRQDFCENCGTDITNEVAMETPDGKLFCEDCYIQNLAHRRGLL